MPILLVRVDDRLVHGQVVVGWGNRLDPDRYVVVDDALMESAWERELYALGVPDGTDVQFVTVDEARTTLPRWTEDRERTVVLLRNVESLFRLAVDGGLDGHEVNLGGIHHRPGSTRVLPYIYLDQEDRERLRDLGAKGVEISARDLPGSTRVSLERLISRAE